MPRKATDRPPKKLSPENRWYESGIEDQRAEAANFREETKRLKYDRMERETDARARRTWDLFGPVDDDMFHEMVENVSDWYAESVKPIVFRIHSPGGDAFAGLAIYDFIVSLQGTTPVTTIGLGSVASMASVLLQAGEQRLLTPHAQVLIHESRFFQEDQPVLEKVTDMKDRMVLELRMEGQMLDILAARSTLEKDEVAARFYRKDWWLTADEAVEYGFADFVVGGTA
jgi:ATP-dependent Clp protease protease subunit